MLPDCSIFRYQTDFKMEITMKYNTVVDVGINLILCIVFLISFGVCQALGETLVTKPEQLKISKPEQLKVSEPKQLNVSKPNFNQVSQPKSAKVRMPAAGLKPRTSKSGVTVLSGNRENKAYNLCAKLKGHDARLKCAIGALSNKKK